MAHKHEHRHSDSGCGHEHGHKHESEHGNCSCGHEHEHEHGNCSCGHDHEHMHDGCSCGHDHEHKHAGCSCGHDHENKHDGCSCGHDHGHKHDGCSCGHDHGHVHGGCGCGHDHGPSGSRSSIVIRLSVSAALLAAALLIPADGIVKLALFMLPYVVIGWDVVFRAVRNIAGGNVFDECFLMTVASLGAFCVGEYAEGVAVMLLYQLGEFFQGIAADRTRSAIAALTDVRPDSANVETEGGIAETDAREVLPGAVIVVKPGERIPLDGVVVSGRSELDQSALTGESLPRSVEEGDRALAGCVNLRGLIRLRVERAYGDSEASRILRLVEDAAERKARSERFITRFARVYTPIVCALAVAIALIPPIFMGNIGEWIHRALIFLVVSCPCALVISVPLTFFAGIGALSRRGVLIKGGCYMDQLAAADTFVFDKTGTLTEGSFRVRDVSGAMSREALIEIAAHAEVFSDHPLAKEVCRAYGRAADNSRISNAEELAGRGVKAVIDGAQVLVGNKKLMADNGIAVEETGGTVLYVARDGEYAGRITLADEPKPSARESLAGLGALGAQRLIMLTGDSEGSAAQVASAVGITEYHAGLLPGDKAGILSGIIAGRSADRAVVFVGDGINDAPSLALADVGIAMGGMGSDAAIEAADVVLMDDDPGKLVTAVKGARRTLAIVRQNIAISLAVKIGVMMLGAIGVAGMWAAVFADVGVCLMAILNASRAMRIKE